MESNNGWITDRLPTRHDVDFTSMVWIWDESYKRPLQDDFQRVAPGQPWQHIIEPPPYVKPRWKPKDGDVYFVCSSNSLLSRTWDDDDPSDHIAYERGNCFQTAEEAEEVFEKITKLLKEHRDGK